MQFKKWLENLAGPGGGPEPHADSPEKLARAVGGAYPEYSDLPIKKRTRSPLDRFMPKHMKKKMKKA